MNLKLFTNSFCFFYDWRNFLKNKFSKTTIKMRHINCLIRVKKKKKKKRKEIVNLKLKK